jgi:RNA polymerase sigma-70 factor, ECF subfamily
MAVANEPQLLSRIMRGDRGALGELLVHYQHRLYNVCLRMVGNRDDAAEVAQDTLLKVVEHIRDYNGQCAISTWMIRIAMNLSISHLRKRRLRRTASLEGTTGPAGGNGEDQGTALREQIANPREPGPHQSVQQREMIGHLHQSLTRLDDDFRAVLVLRDIDELDYQEIADVLGVPVGTVKSRLFRARLALREEMFRVYPTGRPIVSGGARLGEGAYDG